MKKSIIYSLILIFAFVLSADLSLAFDYGLGRPVFLNSSLDGNSSFFAFPWLGINVPFGNKVK